MSHFSMKRCIISLLLGAAFCCPVLAGSHLPCLQRVTLTNREMWQWETELTGSQERNGS